VKVIARRRGGPAPQSVADLPRGGLATIRGTRGLRRLLEFPQTRKFPNETRAPRAARRRLGFRGRGQHLPDFAAFSALELQDNDLAHLIAHCSSAWPAGSRCPTDRADSTGDVAARARFTKSRSTRAAPWTASTPPDCGHSSTIRGDQTILRPTDRACPNEGHRRMMATFSPAVSGREVAGRGYRAGHPQGD
jgi:hypothetical protein